MRTANGAGHERVATLGDRREKDQGLRLLTLEEFVQRPSVSYLVRSVVPARSIVVMFGPPKSGKTFSATDLAMHCAHGIDWHGCRIPKPLRVAFLAGEGLSGLKLRLYAWQTWHDTSEMTGDVRLLPEALSLPDRTGEVLEALRTFKPDLIFVDTLNAYFGAGNENDTADMTRFCTAVRHLRDELDCSVVVIHHTGLADKSRERGSIVLRASADVVAQVDRDENDHALIAFQVIAGRDLEPMSEPIGMRLKRVETDWTDDDGELMTTCIVESAGQPVTLPGRGRRPLGDTQSTVLAIVRELANAKTLNDKGEVLIARHEVTAIAKERGIARQSVSSAWKPLHQRGYLRLVEPGSVCIKVNP